jgi:hypothetical protein
MILRQRAKSVITRMPRGCGPRFRTNFLQKGAGLWAGESSVISSNQLLPDMAPARAKLMDILAGSGRESPPSPPTDPDVPD